VNELCEYQTARCNEKKVYKFLIQTIAKRFHPRNSMKMLIKMKLCFINILIIKIIII